MRHTKTVACRCGPLLPYPCKEFLLVGKCREDLRSTTAPATPALKGTVWKSKCVYSCRPEFPCSGCDQDALYFARGQLLSQIACPGAPTKPAEPVCSKCTPGCADCDVPQPESTKWVPKVGARVKWGADTFILIARYGRYAWIAYVVPSDNTPETTVVFADELRPLPAPKVRKQVEYVGPSGAKVWCFGNADFDDPDEYAPTGRTHEYEVDDE